MFIDTFHVKRLIIWSMVIYFTWDGYWIDWSNFLIFMRLLWICTRNTHVVGCEVCLFIFHTVDVNLSCTKAASWYNLLCTILLMKIIAMDYAMLYSSLRNPAVLRDYIISLLLYNLNNSVFIPITLWLDWCAHTHV